MDTKKRAWEIDGLRGVAIIMMAAFHTVFDLAVYCNMDIDYLHGFWFYVGRYSAILFMFVSGISSTFSNRSIKRGLLVFVCAMMITVVSIPIMGENYIRFGILHFFAAAMILKGIADKLIKNRREWIIIAACFVPVCHVLGGYFSGMSTSLPFLFPFGIITESFTSYDYYPIFPWLKYFLIGIVAGHLLYKDKASIFKSGTAERVFTPLCFLGRHSLLIYMLHQPVILGVLLLVF